MAPHPEAANIERATRAVSDACVAFERAADPAERAAAERVLLDFRRADGAVPLGLGVLAHASLPAAQFHALAAVRDGVARGWAALGGEARAQLERAVVGLLEAPELEHAVQATACELLAAIAKRDAVDALADGAGGGGGAAARLVAHASRLFQLHERQRLGALALLSALVHEFGSPADSHGAGAGGLPAAHQQGVRLDFQSRHLPSLFDALVELLRVGMADAASPPDAPVLARAVGLLATVLGWDFAGTTGAVGAGAPEPAGGGRPGLLAATVRPPAEWRGRADSPALLAAAWELYRRLRAAADGGAAPLDGARALALEGALHGSRQLLIQLASVHRGAFGGEAAHAAHVRESARALVSLCAAPLPPGAPTGADAARAEAADVALIAARLLANSGAAALAALPAGEGGALYGALLGAACARYAALERAADATAAGAEDGGGDDAVEEAASAADAHAELWASLLSAHAPVRADEAHALGAHARELFGAGVRAALAVARADGAADDDAEAGAAEADDAARAERLLALAALGRADGAHAASLLCAELGARTARLRALCAALGGRAADEPELRAIGGLLEELDLCARLGAALLADGADGEAPSVPRALADASCADPVNQPASALLHALLRLTATQDELILAAARAHATGGAGSGAAEADAWGSVGAGGMAGAMSGGALGAVLSPRLAESLLWALSRVAQTYLLGASGAHCGAAAAALGAHWALGTPAGDGLLASCADAAALRLLCWPGDEQLALAGCRLLRALARSARGAAALSAQPAWRRVLAAHAPGSAALAHVPPKAQRVLLEALACAGGASGSAEGVAAYFAELTAVLGARLGALGALGTGPASAPAGATLTAASALALDALCQSARGLSRAIARLAWSDAVAPEARAQLRAQLLLCSAQLAGRLGPALLPRFTAGAAPQLATAILRVHADCARAAALELSAAPASAAPGPVPAGSPLACACELAELSRESAVAYAQHFAGGSSAQGAQLSALEEAEEDARCAQLVAQLRTLLHLAGALADALEDLSERGAQPGAGAAAASARGAAAASAGFCALLPLLSARALAVPKVCAAFFDALGALLALARAPGAPPLSEPLALAARDSLRHGARHGSAEISRLALEAVDRLAAHAARHAPAPAPVAALVRALQHSLLLDLAASQIHPDSADPAAGSALLALIVAQPEAWAVLAEAVASRAAEPDGLRSLFAQLTSAHGVRCALDRPNRARFRANLATFLAAVRQRPHLAAVMSTADS